MHTRHADPLADPVRSDIREAAWRIDAAVVDALRGAQLLITGGTGFLGSWLVDVLLALNDLYRLDMSLSVLTRNRAQLAGLRPDWQTTHGLNTVQGDVRDFRRPDGLRFTHVLHAATDVGIPGINPLELSSTIVTGSRQVLDVAARTGARRYLYFSSGAVTGTRSAPGLISEDTTSAPPLDDPGAYSNAKRFAEHLHHLAATEYGLELVIARGFAFVGPRMPLGKFAIGNFIRDALSGQAPRMNSAGLSQRSYLYAADAAVWLITLLAQGKSKHIYNVGSDQAISVRELAQRVSSLLGAPLPGCGTADEVCSFYVPATLKAREEFGLIPHVLLDEAILKTAQWARNSGALSI